MSSQTRSATSSAGPAVIVGVLSTVALFSLVRVALWSATGQETDQSAMLTVMAGRDAKLTLLSILGRVSVGSIAALTLVCVLLAAVRRHGRAAVAALVVIVGANATTQLLKQNVLDRSDLGWGVHNSLPSGHVTVVASAVAALLIVVPGPARATIAGLGTFAAGLTGMSTIVAGWHRPADVVAALLVSLSWCAVAVVIHGGTRDRSGGAFLTALSGAVASLLGIVLIGVRPAAGLEGFVDASLVLGAVASATAVTIWTMAWLGPRPR